MWVPFFCLFVPWSCLATTSGCSSRLAQDSLDRLQHALNPCENGCHLLSVFIGLAPLPFCPSFFLSVLFAWLEPSMNFPTIHCYFLCACCWLSFTPADGVRLPLFGQPSLTTRLSGWLRSLFWVTSFYTAVIIVITSIISKDSTVLWSRLLHFLLY